MSDLEVTAIPAFSDNYIWLLDSGGNSCAIVDPGDAEPVLETLERQGLDLAYILLTHHHPDHIGGVRRLLAEYNAEVFAPQDDRIAGPAHRLAEGDTASLPALGLEFRVIEVPGHTSSHIAFHGHGSLFCGDTVFSVGCGRLFEGTAEQMQTSLDKLAALPKQTRVYCAHEYTLSNCRFAVQVEPGNEALAERVRQVEAARASGEITVPSELGEELAVNPFLRTRHEAVVESARRRDPRARPGASTLAVIRAWKDSF
jgi:hydroxyacylglutathione hydrolase